VIYRVTFGYAGNGEGWSETHLMKDSSTDPRTFELSKLRSVAAARVTFLGKPFVINRIRCAAYSSDDGLPVPRQSFLIKTEFAGSGQVARDFAEPSVVALQGIGRTLVTTPPPFAGNTNQTFLGAPFDVCVDNAGNVFPEKGGLQASFTAWKNLLVANQYGWGGSSTIQVTNITTATQDDTGRVTIVTEDNLNIGLLVGKFYPSAISGVNQSRAALNGPCIVKVTNVAKTLQTKEVIGIPTPQVGGKIRIYSQIKPFIPYGDIQLQLETIKHKRGRPFGVLPGRRPRRVRG
jgi:hypothetical protein